MLEDAGPGAGRRERPVALDPALGDEDQLARLDATDISRADHVERHRLGSENGRVAELAHHQRPDAERIAAGDQSLLGQADQAVGAFDMLERVDEAIEQRAVGGGGDEMDDHLGVAGRLEDRAARVELPAQAHGVRDVAVMGDGEAAA